MSLSWDDKLRLEQMSEVASAMAYMHLSAAAAAEHHHRSQAVPYQRLFSPSAFSDLVTSFGHFATKRQETQLVITLTQFYTSLVLYEQHLIVLKAENH